MDKKTLYNACYALMGAGANHYSNNNTSCAKCDSHTWNKPMQEEYIPFILFGITSIAIGIAILISAALSGRKGHRKNATEERATRTPARITNEADVVERVASIGNEGSLNFGIKAPVFEILQNGQAIELRAARLSERLRYSGLEKHERFSLTQKIPKIITTPKSEGPILR